MVRKLLLLGLWFPLTLVLLLVNLYFLTTIGRKARELQARSTYQPLQITAASAHGSGQLLGATVYAADARALLLQQFLSKHGSPLANYAEFVVQQADLYQIDYRLIQAIAMCESNAGKRIPSKDSFNAWGIAVYTGQIRGTKFRDWPHAIAWVSRYLKEKYYDQGLTSLSEIGAIWAPPSVENGNSWANCVGSFMEQMQ